jgi:sugar transferase (PEP-CTERM/EpsH1 system associated)
MKLVFVANRIPYPPFRGDKLKIFNLAVCLAPKHELHLITFYETKRELSYEAELLDVFTTVTLIPLKKWQCLLQTVLTLFIPGKPLQVGYFQSKKFKNKLKHTLDNIQPHAIHVQHLRMAQQIPSEYMSKALLDLPDAISLYYQRRASHVKSPFLKIGFSFETNRLQKYEHRILPKFPKVLCCSAEDGNYLQQLHPTIKIGILENGVDVQTYAPRPAENNGTIKILFTGNMNYAPNVDAVQYFADEIFPKIQEKFPEVLFEIAGQKPTSQVLALAKKNGITVTGFIPNLADAYASATLVVAPLRFGAGTQNKVLEALSMNIPVICSPIGFHGIGLIHGEGIWCEKDTSSFIHRIQQILSDIQKHKSLATEAGEKIRGRFNWNNIAQHLENYCLELSTDNDRIKKSKLH